MSSRYIHVSTPVLPVRGGGTTYRRPRQKYPSARKRQVVGSGHYRANDWGAEWYKAQRERAERTQMQQSIKAVNWKKLQEISDEPGSL